MSTCGDGEPDSLPMDQEALSILQILAEAGRVDDFTEAAARIPWAACAAADLVRIVRLALRVGAHLLARDVPPDRSWAANRAWLVAHGEVYRGQRVALKEGKLLAAAPTAREVCDAVDRAAGTLVLKVP